MNVPLCAIYLHHFTEFPIPVNRKKYWFDQNITWYNMQLFSTSTWWNYYLWFIYALICDIRCYFSLRQRHFVSYLYTWCLPNFENIHHLSGVENTDFCSYGSVYPIAPVAKYVGWVGAICIAKEMTLQNQFTPTIRDIWCLGSYDCVLMHIWETFT